MVPNNHLVSSPTARFLDVSGGSSYVILTTESQLAGAQEYPRMAQEPKNNFLGTAGVHQNPVVHPKRPKSQWPSSQIHHIHPQIAGYSLFLTQFADGQKGHQCFQGADVIVVEGAGRRLLDTGQLSKVNKTQQNCHQRI